MAPEIGFDWRKTIPLSPEYWTITACVLFVLITKLASPEDALFALPAVSQIFTVGLVRFLTENNTEDKTFAVLPRLVNQ